MKDFSQHKEALIFALNLPPILGMSNTGGFEIYVQDRTASDLVILGKYVQEIISRANQRPELNLVRTNFNPNVPQFKVEIDKEKAKSFGVEISDIYATLGNTFGTYYVNDFNIYGKVYHVNVQVKGEYRDRVDDFKYVFVRGANGNLVPVSSLIKFTKFIGPSVIQRFNMFQSAQITGEPSPGYSSGDAIKAIEEVAKEVLPNGYSIAYAGTTLQEKRVQAEGSNAVWYALLFIFLILVALYESWTLPLSLPSSSGGRFFRSLSTHLLHFLIIHFFLSFLLINLFKYNIIIQRIRK